MKTFRTALASLSLATLLMAQSAYAATRSFESLPSSGAQAIASVERIGSPIGSSSALANEDDDDGALIVLIFGSVAAFIAFLEAVGAIDIFGDGDGDSPG